MIDAIDYRLVTSNYQMLSEAKQGSRLSKTNSFQLIVDKELRQIKRIREVLGLPFRDRGERSHVPEHKVPDTDPMDVPLRDQLVKKGIEPATYRYVREVRENRIAAKKKT